MTSSYLFELEGVHRQVLRQHFMLQIIKPERDPLWESVPGDPAPCNKFP
jgi:hypothetical protein